MVFLFLDYKAQAFDLATMLYTGCDNIDTGSIDGAVTQNVCKLCNILLDAVKSAGEEFSQIVWKDFRWFHPGRFAQFFHSRPDVTAV